jgi:hypothetical protein
MFAFYKGCVLSVASAGADRSDRGVSWSGVCVCVCVCVCVLEASTVRSPWPTGGCWVMKNKL